MNRSHCRPTNLVTSALLVTTWVFALSIAETSFGDAGTSTASVSFRRDIAPILLKQCQGCHGPDKSKGKFRLDSFERLGKAGESKSAPILAGKPEGSELFRLISTSDEDDRMPKKGPALPAGQIRLIRGWIEQGAKFDGPDPASPLASLVEDEEHPAPPERYPRPVAITALAFAPGGGELAVSGYHEVTLWNPNDGKLTGRIQKLGERTYALDYSPDGKLLAAADGTPGVFGEVRLCEPGERKAGKVLARINDVMLAARFSPDGKQLAAGGSDNSVRIFEVPSGRRELLIEQHADWIIDLDFSPDGTRLVTASRDKSARVFDSKSGAMISAFLNHGEALSGVAFDEKGGLIYSAGKDRRIRIWNAADAKEIKRVITLEAEPFRLRCALGMVFSSGADGIVRQFKREKLEPARSFPASDDWVYSIAIDAKNHRLATGSYGGQVKIWDIDKGTLMQTFVAAPGYLAKE